MRASGYDFEHLDLYTFGIDLLISGLTPKSACRAGFGDSSTSGGLCTRGGARIRRQSYLSTLVDRGRQGLQFKPQRSVRQIHHRRHLRYRRSNLMPLLQRA